MTIRRHSINVHTCPGTTVGTVTLNDDTTGHTGWLRILDTARPDGATFVGEANRIRNRLLSSARGPSDGAEVAQLDKAPRLEGARDSLGTPAAETKARTEGTESEGKETA